jgi:hypothetical protein
MGPKTHQIKWQTEVEIKSVHQQENDKRFKKCEQAKLRL